MSYKHTQEWKDAMSKRMTGNTFRRGKPSANKGTHPEQLQGKNHPMYGKKHSLEARKKMSLAHMGKHPTNEFKKGHVSWCKGLHVNLNPLGGFKKGHPAPATAFKKGVYAGDKHWNWKGGITSENHKLRTSAEYKLWRNAVYERDNYTCIWCGNRGCRLEADHIKPWCDYPALRFAIDNGRTLCKECHKKTDNYGKKLCQK